MNAPREPSPVRVVVVVSTYNRPAALDRVLDSAARQRVAPWRVVVADDGSGPQTAQVVARWRDAFGGRLVHSWQPDDGFRLAESRNRAIARVDGDLFIFVDGDCLMRPGLVAEHLRLAQPGCCVAGNRILLSQPLTEAIEAQRTNPLDWSAARWLRARLRGDVGRLAPLLTLPDWHWRHLRPRDWLQFRGCNIAVWRADLERVDGFDETISGWGFEDTDLAIRLLNAGVRIKSGRYATAVLHLWHDERPRDRSEANRRRALEALRDGSVRPRRGLSAHAAGCGEEVWTR